MVMPSRLRLKGLQRDFDRASNEPKPFRVMRQRVSAPPTTAASASPQRISRRAEAKTLALEEQAVAMV